MQQRTKVFLLRVIKLVSYAGKCHKLSQTYTIASAYSLVDSPYRVKNCFICLTLAETYPTILAKDTGTEINFTKVSLPVLRWYVYTLLIDFLLMLIHSLRHQYIE